jgi:hypothetical protein
MSKPPIDTDPAPDTTGDAAAKNGADDSAVKTESILSKIQKQWVKSGSKMPPAEEGKKLVGVYTGAATKVTEAEAALAKAKAEEYAAVEKLAQAYGCRSLRIGGVVHDFASRGNIIFFRKKSASDVVDL